MEVLLGLGDKLSERVFDTSHRAHVGNLTMALQADGPSYGLSQKSLRI